VILVFLLACRSDRPTNIPDVSDIAVDLEVIRFEQLLLKDTLIGSAELRDLEATYPAFAEIYFNHVIPVADEMVVQTDPELKHQQIQNWIRHPRTQWLYDTVQQVFPNLDDYTDGLTEAFRFGKYYFPEKSTPRIFTTISDFGYFPFIYAEDTLQDGIGVSLEMFLGEDFPYRNMNGLNNVFSDYLVRSYNKDHMVRRTVEVWLDDLAGPPPGNRLLDMMIHNGKKLFILQALLPTTPDTVIMDFPSDKMQWVRDNERNIWTHFTTQQLMYETSLNRIQKYIGPSPSSPGMPPEAPGNTASWLGWQIVKTYMEKFPSTTFPELLAMDNAQKLLDESGYKPPR
jgi:hypothetical protein